MKFEVKPVVPKPTNPQVSLVQDGDQVDIQIDGVTVAFFDDDGTLTPMGVDELTRLELAAKGVKFWKDELALTGWEQVRDS